MYRLYKLIYLVCIKTNNRLLFLNKYVLARDPIDALHLLLPGNTPIEKLW